MGRPPATATAAVAVLALSTKDSQDLLLPAIKYDASRQKLQIFIFFSPFLCFFFSTPVNREIPDAIMRRLVKSGNQAGWVVANRSHDKDAKYLWLCGQVISLNLSLSAVERYNIYI